MQTRVNFVYPTDFPLEECPCVKNYWSRSNDINHAVTDFDGLLTLSHYIFPLYSTRPMQGATVGQQIVCLISSAC